MKAPWARGNWPEVSIVRRLTAAIVYIKVRIKICNVYGEVSSSGNMAMMTTTPAAMAGLVHLLLPVAGLES